MKYRSLPQVPDAAVKQGRVSLEKHSVINEVSNPYPSCFGREYMTPRAEYKSVVAVSSDFLPVSPLLRSLPLSHHAFLSVALHTHTNPQR